MKKLLLVLSLTALLVLGLAGATLAGTAYLDYLVNGETDTGTTQDTSLMILGVDAPFDSWKIGFEYYMGNLDDTDVDFTGYLLKGGYALINDDQTRLDICLGLFNNDTDSDVTISSYILGIDANFAVADNMGILIELDYGFSGTYDNGAEVDLDSLMQYKLKFNYFFTDSFGASLGYYNLTSEAEGGPETTLTGYTLGLALKF